MAALMLAVLLGLLCHLPPLQALLGGLLSLAILVGLLALARLP